MNKVELEGKVLSIKTTNKGGLLVKIAVVHLHNTGKDTITTESIFQVIFTDETIIQSMDVNAGDNVRIEGYLKKEITISKTGNTHENLIIFGDSIKISEKSNVAFNEKKQIYETNINKTEKEYKTIQNVRSEAIISLPIIFNAEGEQFSVLEENEGYGFFSLLKENLELEELSEEIREQLNKTSVLFTHKACFIPSVSWAYLYAKAVRNSKLYTLHVEHDWLHYKDFVNNGLIEIMKSCDENKEVNHVLVLDSLNLTQPECGLKPFLDVIAGYSLILPIFNKTLPVNLKILATIVPFSEDNKIGLPLNKLSFSNWGQVLKPETKIILPSNFLECDTQKGFFEPNDLAIKSSSQNKEWVNNGYFSE